MRALIPAAVGYDLRRYANFTPRDGQMDLNLRGKRAIVTGGSSGLGKATAQALSEEGVDVVIAARIPERLKAAATELSTATGGKVVDVVGDTSDDASVKEMVDGAVEALGGVDILVNAAAIPGGSVSAASLENVASDLLLDDLNVKVAGYLRVAQAVAPHMVANGWGRIISIGGLAARMAGEYSASIRCVAVSALTKNLADELGPKGVDCLSINPGIVRTERNNTPEKEEFALSINTIARMTEPQEIGWLITVLASPKSVTLNGETLTAAGGFPKAIYY